ncbi:MAG: hypothetical protein K1X75_02210 [Leptospirales bacterium]|nr:hypothetical protein [Leptospirales bacterium]
MQKLEEEKTRERLQLIAQSSMEGWRCFLESGRNSSLYRQSLAAVGKERAARIALLELYLETLTLEERRRLESNGENFWNAAYCFVREMVTPRLKNGANRNFARSIFGAAMRRLLAEEGQLEQRREAALFLRAMIDLCSDANAIVAAWQDCRQYQQSNTAIER